MTNASSTIPGYITGTWDIDPVHSEVSFVVRHYVVSKVRGRFNSFKGSIVLADDVETSSAEVEIEAASLDTGHEQRDNHVRSADFLDVEKYPQITFRSTGVRTEGDHFLLDGDLTIHGTTRPVVLNLEANGFGPDPYGGTRAGFSAHTVIDRGDFNVTFNGKIPGTDNAMLLSDKLTINIEIEAALRREQA